MRTGPRCSPCCRHSAAPRADAPGSPLRENNCESSRPANRQPTDRESDAPGATGPAGKAPGRPGAPRLRAHPLLPPAVAQGSGHAVVDGAVSRDHSVPVQAGPAGGAGPDDGGARGQPGLRGGVRAHDLRHHRPGPGVPPADPAGCGGHGLDLDVPGALGRTSIGRHGLLHVCGGHADRRSVEFSDGRPDGLALPPTRPLLHREEGRLPAAVQAARLRHLPGLSHPHAGHLRGARPRSARGDAPAQVHRHRRRELHHRLGAAGHGLLGGQHHRVVRPDARRAEPVLFLRDRHPRSGRAGAPACHGAPHGLRNPSPRHQRSGRTRRRG